AHDEDLFPPSATVRRRTISGVQRFGAVMAIAFGVELWWALTKHGGESGAFPGGSVSSVKEIGRLLFTDYAFPFEVTSVLILIAMVGAVVLARREGPGRGHADHQSETTTT